MLYFIVAFLIVLIDQVVKYLITIAYGMGGQLDIIPGIFRITYVSNTGGAFSLFAEHTLILAIISVIACALIVFLMIKGKMSVLGRLSLGFILGGAIGNMIDRFALGYVVDMFQPTFIDFAVFNVADIFITVGAIMLVIYVIFFWRPGKHKKGDAQVPVAAKKIKKEKKSRKNTEEYDDSFQTAHLNAFGDTVTEDTIIAPPHPSTVNKKPNTPPSSPNSGDQTPGTKKEPSFEDIMREYGHDI